MKEISRGLTAVLLVFTMIFSFTGCGEINKAEKTVNGLFASLKQADLEKISEYMNVADLMNAGDEEDSFISNPETFMQSMFKQLDYKIVSSEKIDNSTVEVTVDITNIDMKPVFTDFFARAIQYAFSSSLSSAQQPTEEETSQKMEEMFIESVTKPNLATVTNTAVITVVKGEDKVWNIESDDDFLNALLGGMYDAIQTIQLKTALAALNK